MPPTEAWRSAFGDNFFYILYFQEPGPADAELAADPARTMRRLMGGMRSTDGTNVFLQMATPGPEGFIERLPEPDGRPDWITAGRGRPLRRRVHQRPDSPGR